MKKIKTITIPHALGIIYSLIVFVMIILGKWEEGVNYVSIWPVYLMLIYSFIVFVFSFITVPLYWFTLPFRKYFIKKGKLTEQNDAKIKPFFIIATLLVALYGLHRLFFLTEDDVWDSFKDVTYRAPPSSASIIVKDTNFFEPCTYALIQMAPRHYMRLLNQLQNDYRFESVSGVGEYFSGVGIVYNPFSISKLMNGYYNSGNINHTFTHRFDTDNSTYFIGFFANQEWVIYKDCFNR
jgi:hypothetical protein